MRNHRSRVVRYAKIVGLLAVVSALAPATTAKVRVGVNLNIALPPHVHVNVGNYEPYYVGRVFYEPMGAWRRVYSFPVETPYGVEYVPYVYDGPRVVCHDYIPGREAGYGRFVIEGRGHYDPRWHHRGGHGRDFDRYHHARGWRDRGDHHRHRGWDDRRAYRRDGDRDHDRNRHERSGSGGRHGKKHKHGHR